MAFKLILNDIIFKYTLIHNPFLVQFVYPVWVHSKPSVFVGYEYMISFYGTHSCHLISDGGSRRGGAGLTYSSGDS